MEKMMAEGKGCGTIVQGKAEACDALVVVWCHCSHRHPAASMCVHTVVSEGQSVSDRVSLGLDQGRDSRTIVVSGVWWMPGKLSSLYQDKLDKAPSSTRAGAGPSTYTWENSDP